MLTKKPSSPKKYLQAVHDTAATSESESEHSEKLQDIQDEKYPSFKKKKIKLAKTKTTSVIPCQANLDKKTASDNVEDTSVKSHAHPELDSSAKQAFELVDDPTVCGATDDDVGDSIIGLESGYTETEVDSDSLSLSTNLNTMKIKTQQKIDGKVWGAWYFSKHFQFSLFLIIVIFKVLLFST